MTRSVLNEPLIAVVGATGTGKSQLAIELAKRFNGEVINADAMQLYAGLPIVTNKVTPEEQEGVPHHLLGRIGLREDTWAVGRFVTEALNCIRDVRSRGRIPVLVGGTHYYTQNLLFRDRLLDETSRHHVEGDVSNDLCTDTLNQPTDTLLERLRKVDPIMADRWHPHDRRKIQRSLEIYLETGRKASDLYYEQRLRKQASNDLGHGTEEVAASFGKTTLRFPTLIFWTYARADVLRDRLQKRVLKMLSSGLLNEVRMLNDFAAAEAEAGRPVDKTRGIFVAIGYKEFVNSAQDDKSTDSDLETRKAVALEKTQTATWQYAKRQLRWIRIKLINALAEANMHSSMFVVDSSDLSRFQQTAVAPAIDITMQFLQGAPLPSPRSVMPLSEELLKPKRDYDLSTTPEKWIKRECEVCNVTCVTNEQWDAHVGSKAHKKILGKSKKCEEKKSVNASKENPHMDPDG